MVFYFAIFYLVFDEVLMEEVGVNKGSSRVGFLFEFEKCYLKINLQINSHRKNIHQNGSDRQTTRALVFQIDHNI